MKAEAHRLRSGAPGETPEEPPASSQPSQLIESCQGLVRSLAWKVHQRLPPHVDLEDLISFGQLGLVEAARAYDASRGVRFTTFAYYRVRGAIFDGLSKMSWFSHHDYHRSRYERMANEVLELESSEEFAPGTRSRAEETGWLKNITGRLAIVYLAAAGDPEDESGPAELEDKSVRSPPAQAIQKELRQMLHKLIGALSADAGELIRAVYFEGVTLKEAADRLGISKAWASRLHAKTLQRLAQALRRLGVSE